MILSEVEERTNNMMKINKDAIVICIGVLLGLCTGPAIALPTNRNYGRGVSKNITLIRSELYREQSIKLNPFKDGIQPPPCVGHPHNIKSIK